MADINWRRPDEHSYVFVDGERLVVVVDTGRGFESYSIVHRNDAEPLFVGLPAQEWWACEDGDWVWERDDVMFWLPAEEFEATLPGNGNQNT